MSDPKLVLLTEDRDLSGFDCGNAQLNDWLARHALASQRADLARTYLALEGDVVLGYVSLTTGSIRPEHAPKRYVRGMPRHPIPTILIAGLAVDRRHQRQGMGSRLLAEALRRSVQASDAAAARLIVVDAIDQQAAQFYSRWGFIAVPENPLRLFRKTADVRRTTCTSSRTAQPSTGSRAWSSRRVPDDAQPAARARGGSGSLHLRLRRRLGARHRGISSISNLAGVSN